MPSGSRRISTRQPPSSPLAKRVVKTHQRLLASPFYLAHPDFRDNVKWFRCGNADVLVERSSKEPVTPLQPEDDPSDISPDPVIISLVFQITPDDFFMTSDGGYQGPSKFVRSLADVKPTCTGTLPSLEPFRADFSRVVDNIQWLEDEAATPTFELKRGFLIERPDQPPKIRVRHVLFEPRPREETSERADSERSTTGPSDRGDVTQAATGSRASSLPREFTLEAWPVHSDAARKDLASMKNARDYDVIPLPAYDVNGKLIRPQDYRDLLAGAVVEVHLTLTHWTIASRRGEPPADTYVADVQYMRVLVPAPRPPTLPRKRRISLMDPLSSPSKKQRT